MSVLFVRLDISKTTRLNSLCWYRRSWRQFVVCWSSARRTARRRSFDVNTPMSASCRRSKLTACWRHRWRVDVIQLLLSCRWIQYCSKLVTVIGHSLSQWPSTLCVYGRETASRGSVSGSGDLLLLPTSLAGKVIQSVVYSCPSVRPFVSTLSFERTDLWPWYFANVWIMSIHDHSLPGLKVKVSAKMCATRVSTAASYEYWLTAVILGFIIVTSSAAR